MSDYNIQKSGSSGSNIVFRADKLSSQYKIINKRQQVDSGTPRKRPYTYTYRKKAQKAVTDGEAAEETTTNDNIEEEEQGMNKADSIIQGQEESRKVSEIIEEAFLNDQSKEGSLLEVEDNNSTDQLGEDLMPSSNSATDSRDETVGAVDILVDILEDEEVDVLEDEE
ncbi:hypothetical protein BGZ76_007393, partial [Entomortierella beljakovae]